MNSLLRSAVIIALVFAVGQVFAAPTFQTTPGRIKNSQHDLSRFSGGDTERSELCIYCHTPHNALVNVPLWNRFNPSPTLFSLYNSPTLTPATKAASLSTWSISLFCMSCHDGITGLGYVHNVNAIGGGDYPYGIQFSRGANNSLGVIPSHVVENPRFGTMLTNSHPVGFEFTSIPDNDSGIRDVTSIMAAYENKKRAADPSGLFPAAAPATYFLYGPNSNMFECASCHRVHDPGTSGNFLRIENDRSELCFACHNK